MLQSYMCCCVHLTLLTYFSVVHFVTVLIMGMRESSFCFQGWVCLVVIYLFAIFFPHCYPFHIQSQMTYIWLICLTVQTSHERWIKCDSTMLVPGQFSVCQHAKLELLRSFNP